MDDLCKFASYLRINVNMNQYKARMGNTGHKKLLFLFRFHEIFGLVKQIIYQNSINWIHGAAGIGSLNIFQVSSQEHDMICRHCETICF